MHITFYLFNTPSLGPTKTEVLWADISFSRAEKLSEAMMIMELPVGASSEKKAVGMENVRHILDNAHALRAPGQFSITIYPPT